MTRLFAATLFLSATLLFVVQPVAGRRVLPVLGGAPAVWNTCLVFFQAALLGGYLYAHLLGRAPLRAQAFVHTGVLLAGLAAVGVAAVAAGSPVAVPPVLLSIVPREASPIPWLLLTLLATIGLPFLALSASAPLLQRWFSATGGAAARDPYFLYSASNAGSLLALLAYPVAIEPFLGLGQQGWAWAGGGTALLVLVALCARAVARVPPPPPSSSAPTSGAVRAGTTEADIAIPLARRLRWGALAAVPSSLLLGVTTSLSTDVAPIPLLWVVPLALYLLTFVLVFARRPPVPHALAVRWLAVAAILLALVVVTESTEPVGVVAALHLATLFLAAMVCHGELARDRPDARHLTTFYLWQSLGGVAGGLFNALVAPALFVGVAELPLALVLACLLRPAPARAAQAAARDPERAIDPQPNRALAGREGPHAESGGAAVATLPRQGGLPQDAAWALGIGGVAVALVLTRAAWAPHLGTLASAQIAGDSPVATGISFGVPLVLCYLVAARPRRFALALGAVFLASLVHPGTHGRTLFADRSFFGVLRVTEDPTGGFHRLVHGSTIHGRQLWIPEPSRDPLTYYARSGPAGDVFRAFRARPASGDVAVVGLGAGTLASYARSGERWTFYEIDPAVERIARDPACFTFLRRAFPQDGTDDDGLAAGERLRIEIGDARLRLADAADARYGLIVLDAFSSDAVPVHLLTREALDLYLRKLAPGGLLAFHVSNRYLDLAPLVAGLAHERVPPLLALHRNDADLSPGEEARGHEPSEWVVLARRREDAASLCETPTWWEELAPRPDAPVWTDDFSNVLGVFRGR